MAMRRSRLARILAIVGLLVVVGPYAAVLTCGRRSGLPPWPGFWLVTGVTCLGITFLVAARGLGEHGVDVERLVAELDEDLRALPKKSDARRPTLRLEATSALQWGVAHERDFGHRMAAALAGVLQVHCVARDRLRAHGVREEMLRPIAEPKARGPVGDEAIVLTNDDVTPLSVVVELLGTHLRMTDLEAWDLAAEVHVRGSVCVWRCNREEAARLAAAIADGARSAGFPLQVRVERAERVDRAEERRM
jgi:ATP-dependent Clp protease adapter protein ClpS